jgi:hypothetical protein
VDASFNQRFDFIDIGVPPIKESIISIKYGILVFVDVSSCPFEVLLGVAVDHFLEFELE